MNYTNGHHRSEVGGRTRMKWNVPSSEMARNTLNPIRKLVDELELTPNPDKEMIALSIGDPTVFGNLQPDENVKIAVLKITEEQKTNGYAPSVGYANAREAVAKYESPPNHSITAEDVILASGCSGALDLAISVIANPGQNILVPRPGFSLYKTLADSLGIEVRLYNLKPENQWQVDLIHLESLIDDNTTAVIVNNPSNPCGSVFPKEHIKEILKLAERNALPIIADEIYAHFVFAQHEYHSMASQSENVPILSCGGLTKRFLLPGWRMGWVTIHDRHGIFEKEIRRGLLSLSQRILGPNTLIQGALPQILQETPQSFFDRTIQIIQDNAEYCYDVLVNIPGLKPVMPQGAMYMMVGIDITCFPDFKSEVDFTERLVNEQSLFCLPASVFQLPNFFRIVLTIPEEMMREACKRITEFCRTHYRK